MTHAHHTLLANRLRNLARRMDLELRSKRLSITRGELIHWRAAVESAASELDGPPWALEEDAQLAADAPDGARLG